MLMDVWKCENYGARDEYLKGAPLDLVEEGVDGDSKNLDNGEFGFFGDEDAEA
jgi:hypothetical protein